MLTLYPAISPYAEHKLKVDEIHTIHVEECGSPDGLPVLFLHGGPGIGCDADHRRFFDPNRYRIILFDQRGCGRSTPHAELRSNTIQDLCKDMEQIRDYCNVDKWLLFGGSWGSTLALYYAQHHPVKVLGMILRGIFLCRKSDLDWFYKEGGVSRIFPEHWERFIAEIPANKRNNILKAYHNILTGNYEISCMAAAKAWAHWEAVCATLDPNHRLEQRFDDVHLALTMAKIEAHYFINNAFLGANGVLTKPALLANIPGTIIHGRYDMICPLDNAYTLSKAWPQADLDIIRNAGHSSSEAGITDALISATNNFSC